MSAGLRLALAPLPAWRGDLAGNAARILAARTMAAEAGAALLVTPQYSLTGILPPARQRDPACAEAAEVEIARLAAETTDDGPGILLGAPWMAEGRHHDGLVLLDGGRVVARRARHEVARGEFVDPGPAPGPVAFRGVRLGLLPGLDRDAPAVAETLAETGAELLLAVAAEPFHPGAAARRVDAAVARVVETGLALAFLNALGGEDGQVADGAAFVLNPDRSLAVQSALFQGGLVVTDWIPGEEGWACRPLPLAPALPREEETWRALRLAVIDQAARTGRGRALVVLDAADADRLAALAMEALGPDRVRGLRFAEGPGAEPGRGLPIDTLDLAPALAGFAATLGAAPSGEVGLRLRALAWETLAERQGALPLGPGGFDPLAGLDAATLAALRHSRAAPSTRDDAEPAP